MRRSRVSMRPDRKTAFISKGAPRPNPTRALHGATGKTPGGSSRSHRRRVLESARWRRRRTRRRLRIYAHPSRTEVPVSGFVTTLATIWRLAVPYFRSEDRWAGRILLMALVAVQLSLVGIAVLLN